MIDDNYYLYRKTENAAQFNIDLNECELLEKDAYYEIKDKFILKINENYQMIFSINEEGFHVF